MIILILDCFWEKEKYMTEIEKLMKCPECYIEGRFEIILRKKTIEVECENCNFTTKDRLPYPKHRYDEDGYIYPFRVGDVRPIWTRDDDTTTISQEEWDERNS